MGGLHFFYERTICFSKGAHRAEGGAGNLLVVRLRAFEEPAVLRWIAQRNRPGADENGDQGSKNSGMVRLQAFEDDAVLRWVAFEVAVDDIPRLQHRFSFDRILALIEARLLR